MFVEGKKREREREGKREREGGREGEGGRGGRGRVVGGEMEIQDFSQIIYIN